MKRIHLHIAVADLDRSIGFYSTLFGAEPAVVEADYAKWMLEATVYGGDSDPGTHAAESAGCPAAACCL